MPSPVFLELVLGLLQQAQEVFERRPLVLVECVGRQTAQLADLALKVPPLLLQRRALAQQALHLA